MSKFREIVEKNLKKCSFYPKGVYRLLEDEKAALFEELGELSEEILQALCEVNQALVDRNNYLTDDLVQLILPALNNIPKSIIPSSIKINGRFSYKLLIDDPNHNFPDVHLACLDDFAGTYTYPPKIITLDILDYDDKIDPYKLEQFKLEHKYSTISHELEHDNQRELLKVLGKPTVYWNKATNINNDYTELDAFYYQVAKSTQMELLRRMPHSIKNKAKTETLDNIFRQEVQDIIKKLLKNDPTSAPVFKLLSEKHKKHAFQYIYSQAKDFYTQQYKAYNLMYEAERKAL